ncbi:MAG: tRNA (N(6)-L-threonylcarbamoyladenosine(37)-C(2))-methylthiotransferase MtaB [Clostridiales bacterium]|nr:tRNA (N(6)-L-threonylcarbamoyladenosine(37)-C(2))-methylthiotransferase MtaB [Clostridiales bacterium]
MRIVIYTLGCKVNQYESDGIAHLLKEKGHQISTEIVPADIYILNSCAVTNEAEKKSRQTIAKFKTCNKNAKIIVCGCASQKDATQFSNMTGVTFIKGTANKLKIIENLENVGVNIDNLPLEYNEEFVSMPTKTRAHIKIQDGCNNFCSYCIIPYLRGRSRSRGLEQILNEVDRLSKIVKEIVITGIDITDYKINGERAISTLIEKLQTYKSVRFRLGSLEQGILDQIFINAIKKANICPHFHLSLQSGCDETLKRMNRKYKVQDYLNSVKLIKDNFEDASITTDIIVGFPGETEEEFLKTCEFAKTVGFYNIHIFPYSKRSGTIAERMPQVDGKVKKERAKKLANINIELNKKFINKCTNKIFTVLTEETDGEYVIGHTENYIKCYIQEPCNLNEFIQVKIIKQYKDGAIAKIFKGDKNG